MGQAVSVKQCSVDSDCKLDACSCTCMNKDVFAECEIAKDCPNEVGVSGCVCANGVCAVVTNPNWRLQNGTPTGQQAECGNGICESGEGTSSCPADCSPISESRGGHPDNTWELVTLIAVVIVLIAAVIIVRFWLHKRSQCGGKPEKKE